jgi:hypothetical protein
MASLVGVLGAALAMGGCTEDGTSLHVVCSIAPEISEEGCLYNPEGACEFQGVLNVQAAEQYAVALRVESGLTERASAAPPRPEPNRLAITGGTVEIRKPNGAPIKFAGLKNPFPFLGSGSVDPGGQGAITATLIPPECIDQLRENAATDDALTQIVLAVSVKGKTDGEVEMESAEWQWPLKVVSISPVEGEGCRLVGQPCQSKRGSDSFADACLECPSDNNLCLP